MKTGPRYKIAKRLGASVFEKAQTQKFAISEARAAAKKKRPRGASEFGRQLLEKQKVRITYGLPERQFSRYVKETLENRAENPIEGLHRRLELRLDNVVWRLGLSKTRRGARQMVSHGHILVNGRRITIPSHTLKKGATVGVREGSKASPLFLGYAERFSEMTMPSWLSFDPQSLSGTVGEAPTTSSAPTAGDLSAVLSFYSR